MGRPTTTAELREAFLRFFEEKGCTRYASAPLVTDDPTTLFTVAGMSQFKDMFLGRGTMPFARATTCQKCMRTNDILQVGRTPRHHTFFEMLGNFSFDDYFKRETIAWAWEFLTGVLELDAERLWVTVNHIDDEAWRIWAEDIGFPEARMVRLGDDDNFWPAGAPTGGPLGPGGCCSEIFWDFRTNDRADAHPGNDEDDRFVEIWNLVFPQFNVSEPKVDGRYTLKDLGRTNIDTGAGLERLACVVQGKRNNFDTDIFQALIAKASAVTGVTYQEGAARGSEAEGRNALLRRIADHVRGVTFAIADGAMPANTGAGYIVRRLIRRAVLDADKLGTEEPCLFAVVPAVVATMGEAYPEVTRRGEQATALVEREERQFRSTLRRGLDLLERELAAHPAGGVFDGDKAFRLYETYGFPREVTEEILAEKGMTIDDAAWRAAEAAHRDVSRSKGVEVFTASALRDAKPRLGTTPFIGYDQLTVTTELVLLEIDGAEAGRAETGTTVRFALDRTPFYAESGGQVADRGTVVGTGPDGQSFTIRVDDVRLDEGLVIHAGPVVAGVAAPGQVEARVDEELRRATTRHHSATHLLHQALCTVLGDHVEQQGSKVEPRELRFDFNHPQQPTREELARVERMVNDHIILDHQVDIRVVPLAEAQTAGAKALFGEKYGERVRMVRMGPVSTELCGGCHVTHTGDIGAFRIVREEASSAGVRRLVAVAGDVARELAEKEDRLAVACGRSLGVLDPDPKEVAQLGQLFKVADEEVPTRVANLVDEVTTLEEEVRSSQVTQLMPAGGLFDRVKGLQVHLKQLRREADAQRAQQALARVDEILEAATLVGTVPVVVGGFTGIDGKGLREAGDALRRKQGSGCVVLGADNDGKAVLLVLVSPDLVERGLKAGDLVARLAPIVGGGGGGRPDQAQAGGKRGDKVTEALEAVPRVVAELCAQGSVRL